MPIKLRSDWFGRVDVALICLSLIAVVLRSVDPVGQMTGLLSLAAALLLPGAVVAHLLPLHDPLAWLAVCVSASLAMVVLGSMVMLWAGAWSPDRLAVLFLVTSVTSLAAHALGYWGALAAGTSTRA